MDAVTSTAKLLEGMGHHVEEVKWPVDVNKIGESFMVMYFGEMHAKMKEIPKILNRKVKNNEVELTPEF